ncbi:MAG: IS200/IS605 family transposase [Terriglobales bacterium]
MAHSYVCVYVHIVFSTKDRRPFIPEDKTRLLWKYLAGIAKHYGMRTLAIGGMPDHVHILLSVASEMPVAKAVNVLKSNSSKWMRAQAHQFAWQEGYAAFSVSTSGMSKVTDYINHQPEHHKTRDFAQEYLSLLKKHGVKYDPAWVLG